MSRLCLAGLRSKFVSVREDVSRPQNVVLRHRSLPLLRHVRTRSGRLPHRGILLEGEGEFGGLQRSLYPNTASISTHWIRETPY